MEERYVDGFLLPIAKENIERYREVAAKAGEIWKGHGALEYYECLADDLEHEEMVSFKKAAGASEDETVVLSWIIYPTRADRDRINAAVMDDPRIKEMMVPGSEPFDCKRMAYGGFKTIIRL